VGVPHEPPLNGHADFVTGVLPVLSPHDLGRRLISATTDGPSTPKPITVFGAVVQRELLSQLEGEAPLDTRND
jgi:hypothetical protein